MEFSPKETRSMNLLRPFSSRMRHFLSSGLIIFLVSLLFSLFGIFVGSSDIFLAFLEKVGFSIGSRAFSLALRGMGCCGGLALAIGFAVRAFAEETPFFGHNMAPSECVGDREVTPSSSGNWRQYLNLSSENEGTSAPETSTARYPNPVQLQGEEADPPHENYPYHYDDVIGGDSVLSIKQRLLEKESFPPAAVIEMVRIQAQDLFEVKVEIINLMAGLDPRGDWMGRGARALDNPRTATGDESLEKLYGILDELKQGGVESPIFSHLRSKVFLKWNDEDQNSAS